MASGELLLTVAAASAPEPQETSAVAEKAPDRSAALGNILEAHRHRAANNAALSEEVGKAWKACDSFFEKHDNLVSGKPLDDIHLDRQLRFLCFWAELFKTNATACSKKADQKTSRQGYWKKQKEFYAYRACAVYLCYVDWYLKLTDDQRKKVTEIVRTSSAMDTFYDIGTITRHYALMMEFQELAKEACAKFGEWAKAGYKESTDARGPVVLLDVRAREDWRRLLMLKNPPKPGIWSDTMVNRMIEDAKRTKEQEILDLWREYATWLKRSELEPQPAEWQKRGDAIIAELDRPPVTP